MTPSSTRSLSAARRSCGFLLSAVLVTAMLVVPAAAGDDSTGDDAPRLSGTIVTPDVALAVVVLADGRSRIHRIGDVIQGWGRLLEIDRESVRFATADGEDVARLTGIDVPVPATPTDTVDAGPDRHPAVALSVDMVAALSELVHREDATGSDLDLYLLPHLDLPGSARIEAINHAPVTGDRDDLDAVREALEQQTPLRLTIGGVDGTDAVYILPQGPDSGMDASAGR